MGRTEPTFRNLLDRLELEWRDYRRGLTGDEQRAFDALFQKARAHASASGNAGRVDPMESVFVSILLEHEQEIRRLRAALSAALEEVARRAHADVQPRRRDDATGEGSEIPPASRRRVVAASSAGDAPGEGVGA